MSAFPTTVPGIPSPHVHCRTRSSAAVQRVSILVLALILLFYFVNAQANVAIVIVGGQGLTFSPQTIDINAGDTVTFLNFGGVHNVVANDGSFRCAHGCDNDGHGGNGGATGQLWSVSVVFPNAGTIGYFCETHGTPGTGMFGTIHVLGAAPPPPEPAASAVSIGGTWFLVLLGAALITCAAPWLRRTRRTQRR